MGLGQALVRAISGQFYYFDFLDLTVAAPESLEALDGNLTAGCYELNELCPLAIIQLLQNLPQPLDHWGAC